MVRAHKIGCCLALFGLLFLALRPGLAAPGVDDQSPQGIIKSTTGEVLSALRDHRNEYQKDPRQLASLIERIVAPHFDIRLMSRWVLGLHWRGATSEQQSRFMAAFRQLLIDDYANVFQSYSNQEVKFQPAPTGRRRDYALVATRVVTPGKRPVQVDYRLYRTATGWRIFDVDIDGLSLLFNYRNSFSEQLQHAPLEALIARIEQKNASLNLRAGK